MSRKPSHLKLVLAGAIALATLGPGLAVPATITVTDYGDDSVTNGTCTVREAIRAANTNLSVDACNAGQSTATDTIRLPAGTYTLNLTGGANEDASLTGDLDITQSLRIVGAAADYTIIDGLQGQSIDRVLDIHAPGEAVTITDLTITGGDAVGTDTPVGGNLRNVASAELVLVDVTLSDGRADRGGGLHSASAAFLYRTDIAGNTAIEDLGSAGNCGGGILSTATLQLEDSLVSNNTAGDCAGGIQSAGGAGSLTVYRSQISGNSAGQNGGGVNAEGNFDIQYTLIDGNTAGNGGGMYMAGAGEITHSAIINNTATGNGGGVYDDAAGFVRYSTLAGNSAAAGGAVYADSNQTLLDSNTVAGNAGGGGVFNAQGLFFENTLIAANAGGNCTGVASASGAFNLEDTNTCGFVDDPGNDSPNFPNTDPLLGALQDNGGPTPTMAVDPGSPAIDAVSSLIRINCEKVLDQRGRPRGRPRVPADPKDEFLCDIGAYEYVAPLLVDDLTDQIDADPADDVCLTASGSCTLRAAVMQANATVGLDEIQLPAGTVSLSLGGPGEDAAVEGDLDLTDPVIIRGAGTSTSAVDGAALDRVFEVRRLVNGMSVHAEPRVTLFEHMTISGGATAGDGGGIHSNTGIRLNRVAIADNSGTDGAGVFCIGDCILEVFDSIFERNTGTSNGGGLFQGGPSFGSGYVRIDTSTFRRNTGSIGGAGEASRLRLRNSTVSGNDAGSSAAFFASSAVIESSTIIGNEVPFQFGDSGAFYLLDLSVIVNTIIADNTVDGSVDNCTVSAASVVSLGHNITDTDAADCGIDAITDQTFTDPMVGSLTNNGGPTMTMTLLPGSPAIDAGDDTRCPDTDQRGLARPQDGDGNGTASCDIGAVEIATAGQDTDSDGIADGIDNCLLAANASQFDADQDGIGNACDADLNNDCLVNFGDLALFKGVFFPNPYDANADFNSDDLVNFADLAFMKSSFFNSLTPGPGPGLPGNLCQ